MSSGGVDQVPAARSRLRFWLATMALAGAGLFVVLTTAAMALFPGGATFDLVAHHYLFFDNYISDLGATHTYSGRPNGTCRVLFTVALAGVGVSLALFGPACRAWTSRGRDVLLGVLTTVVAAASGAFFVATAFTPWDRSYYAHTDFVRIAFGLVVAFVACLTGMQIHNRAPRPWVAANVAYVVVFAGYVTVMWAGPGIGTRPGLRVQVAAQKVLVYATVLVLGVQAWAVRRQTGRTAR